MAKHNQSMGEVSLSKESKVLKMRISWPREGERELVAWVGLVAMEWLQGCQGQALAYPKSLAQENQTMGVCVHEKFHS